MLKTYIKGREAILGVRRDENGVVSFEYVIVAACVVGAVAAAFGTDATTGIGLALTNALAKVTAAITAAA